MKYCVIKTAFCGNSDIHDPVGTIQAKHLDINEAYIYVNGYRYSKCNCKVEVKEEAE